MPTQVSLDASISFNSPTTRPSYMNSMEYANWMNAANNLTNGRDLFSADEMEHITAYFNDPANNSPVFVTTDPNSWQYGNCQAGKYAYCGNTDWMKEMYKKSYPLQQYNVNISGGSDKATYYTSVGYTDQGSLLRHGRRRIPQVQHGEQHQLRHKQLAEYIYENELYPYRIIGYCTRRRTWRSMDW